MKKASLQDLRAKRLLAPSSQRLNQAYAELVTIIDRLEDGIPLKDVVSNRLPLLTHLEEDYPGIKIMMLEGQPVFWIPTGE